MGSIIIGTVAFGFVMTLIGLAAYLGLGLLAAVLAPIDRGMHRLMDGMEARWPKLRR